MALKCMLAVAVALAALAEAAGGAGVMLLVAGPAAAFMAPDALIARGAARRAKSLREQAPDFLDRLRLACEAGLNPDRALTLAAGHGEGLLVEEIRAALAAASLGLPRKQAHVTPLHSLPGTRGPRPGRSAGPLRASTGRRSGPPSARSPARRARSGRAGSTIARSARRRRSSSSSPCCWSPRRCC